MVRFLHTADWHLGSPNTPEVYKTEPLRMLLKTAKIGGFDFILCAGDIFDTPRPDQRVKDYLLNLILTNDKVKFIFTVGNHDYIDKGMSYHSLKYLRDLREVLPNVTVLDEEPGYDWYDFSGTIIRVLPTNLNKINNTCPADIIVWHGTLPGLNYCGGVSSSVSTFVESLMGKFNAKYFALGDIHKRLRITKNCAYPGSLYQKTYACEAGLLSVELGDAGVNKLVEITQALPKRITAEVKLELGKDTEKTVVEMVRETVKEKCFLKLKFKTTLNSWAALNKQYIVDSLRDSFYEIKLENDPVFEDSNLRIAVNKDHVSLDDELKAVVDTIQNKDIKKDQLLKFCKKLVEKLK